MGAAVAFAGWPWSVATTGVMRVAMALAMAASLLLVNANHHWAAMAVGVCVQAVVALLLVRACALRDESDGASHVRFALLLAPRLSFFFGGGGLAAHKIRPCWSVFFPQQEGAASLFFFKERKFFICSSTVFGGSVFIVARAFMVDWLRCYATTKRGVCVPSLTDCGYLYHARVGRSCCVFLCVFPLVSLVTEATVVACFALEPSMQQTAAIPACGAPVAEACRRCASLRVLGDVVWFSRGGHQQWPVYAAATARCPACQTLDACVWSKRCASASWTDDTEHARVRDDGFACPSRRMGPPLSTAIVRHLSVREVAFLGGIRRFAVPFEARQVTMALVFDNSEHTHSRLVWHRMARHHTWAWYFLWPRQTTVYA